MKTYTNNKGLNLSSKDMASLKFDLAENIKCAFESDILNLSFDAIN